MNISRVQKEQIQRYNLEQANLQRKREEDYLKAIQKRNLDDIIAERVARNIRLNLDKGHNIDLEC
jgi:hypothetical protein